MKIISSEYKGFKIYGKERSIALDLGKKIISKDYKIIEVYKDTNRNYVAKISIEGNFYTLKSPRSENIILQRRLKTFFQKGEALTTFYNLNNLRERGFQEFIEPIAAIVKKRILIEESYILFEYVEGIGIDTYKDIDLVLTLIKKIHEKGIYHGDLNMSNFLKSNGKIRILDTQGKKEKFGYFKRYCDILNLRKDNSIIKNNYDINKKFIFNKFSFSYFFALIIKDLKKTKWILKFREIKKEWRKEKWKK